MNFNDPVNSANAPESAPKARSHTASTRLRSSRRPLTGGANYTGRADTIDQLTAYGDMAAKMAKMSGRCLEAITKFRAGGEHRYAVTHTHNHNHLHVADGRQAIIGNNSTGGGGDLKIERQGHAPLALADASGLGLAVWGEDPERETVPRAGDEGQEAVSHARERRRAGG